MELNKIYNENCLNTMEMMPDEFVDLTVTSPPYDNLRSYNGYSFDFESIAQELFRVTKKGGVVVWVVGDATVNGSETGTSFKQALYFMTCGFNLFDTMIYEKINCPMRGSLLGYNQVFEYMFVLSKGIPKTRNLLRDRRNAAKRQQKVITHRTKSGKLEEQGSYKSKEEGLRYNIWSFANGSGVTSKDDVAFEHPAIFPEQLAADHIYSWSNKDDLVYDPFGGSGTTAKMAHLQKRNWILSEISSEYCGIAKKRIQPYLNQTTLF